MLTSTTPLTPNLHQNINRLQTHPLTCTTPKNSHMHIEKTINFTIDELNSIAQKIEIDKEDSYLKTYPTFIQYFKKLQEIDEDNMIIGISLVYSWMPTILKKLDLTNTKQLTDILNEVKSGKLINAEELKLLKHSFNNSMVGTSKLLHFINPERYTIWDSKVYQSLHGKTPYNDSVNKTERYFKYLEWIENIKKEDSFKSFYETMKNLLGNDITANRAIEYALFKKTGSLKEMTNNPIL